jgi:hypothetical protein
MCCIAVQPVSGDSEKEEAQKASSVALEEMMQLMFVSSRANGDLALASKLNQDVADVAIGATPFVLHFCYTCCQLRVVLTCAHPCVYVHV